MPYLRTHTEEKLSQISNITFASLHFSHKNTYNYIAILSTFESTSLDETIRCTSKWSIRTQRMQNVKFINLKCVTYAQRAVSDLA